MLKYLWKRLGVYGVISVIAFVFALVVGYGEWRDQGKITLGTLFWGSLLPIALLIELVHWIPIHRQNREWIRRGRPTSKLDP